MLFFCNYDCVSMRAKLCTKMQFPCAVRPLLLKIVVRFYQTTTAMQNVMDGDLFCSKKFAKMSISYFFIGRRFFKEFVLQLCVAYVFLVATPATKMLPDCKIVSF